MVRSLLLVSLLSTGAWAQTITLSYPGGAEVTSQRFNAVSCSGQQTITWSSTVVGFLCGDLKLWSSELACGDAPGPTDVTYTAVSQSELALLTGDFQVSLAELPAFIYGDGGVVCGTDAVEKRHNICGAFSVNNATSGLCTVQQASSLTLTYDTKPPVAPVIDSITEQDSALLVHFSATSDTATVHIEARAQGETDFTERGEVVATGTSIRISNLLNGTTYEVQARAEDEAENVSVPSEIFVGTPRRTKGFWANYRESGGTEKGGCSAVHGLPLVLAGGLWLLRRKRN